MNIDWEKIKKDYPKSYKKFISKIFPFDVDDFKTSYLTPICYCKIEKFFRENGILILYKLLYKDFDNFEYYILYEKDKCTRRYYQSENELLSTQSYDIMILKSVYKAFEIMEDMS